MARVLKIQNGYRPPKKSHKKVWLIVAGVVLLILLLLNSSLFSVRSVVVEGNARVSREEIMEDLDLELGTNLFRYMISHWNDDPRVDPRLSSVDIYVQWPSSVRIVVSESLTIGYVYFQGTYLCIDRNGYVATSTYTLDEDLPIIQGIEVGSFSLGESLDTQDTERYEAVVTIGTILQKHDLSTTVSEINIRSLDDIILYTDKLEIHCGTIEDIEQKISVIRSVLDNPNVPSGVMHIESLDQQVYIEPTTQADTDSSAATN